MPKLKRIKDQVIAITGATSGIGLTTARMAVARGAQVILIARNVKALESLTRELNHPEKTAKCFVSDVGNEEDLGKVAREACRAFGRQDRYMGQ
jgi:NADP-dependent 3-hydroxy acid dehydrogenase YdfG